MTIFSKDLTPLLNLQEVASFHFNEGLVTVFNKDRTVNIYQRLDKCYEKSNFRFNAEFGYFAIYFDTNLQVIVKIARSSIVVQDARSKEKLGF